MFFRFLMLHEYRHINTLTTVFVSLMACMVVLWLCSGTGLYVTKLFKIALLILGGMLSVGIPLVLIPGYTAYRNARLVRKRVRKAT